MKAGAAVVVRDDIYNCRRVPAVMTADNSAHPVEPTAGKVGFRIRNLRSGNLMNFNRAEV